MNQLSAVNELTKPSIKKYSKILKFCNDYFKYRKALDSKFSYDIWSAELGFKSRSFTYLICSGKRAITSKVANILSDYFCFNANEKKHFLLLSLYEKAKTPDLKSIYFEKIIENLDIDEKNIDTVNYSQFIISPTMPIIKMLLSYQDFVGTLKNLEKITLLSKKYLTKDLNELVKMDLIKKVSSEASNEFYWVATSKAFCAPDDQTNEIMDLFHSSTMSEATKKINQLEIFKRFRSILFAINSSEQPSVLEDLEQFLLKMKNKYGQDNIKNKQIIKLNLQLYPLTNLING